ncbi:MAG: FkbM family methyltransferase [Burkholderiaceae bacterium]|jgi:FkbM family methyltransferase
MATLKRRIVDAVADRLGLEVVRKGMAWELIELEQLRRFFESFRVDCVFDVGANAGQYAMRLREIGFSGRIISFEPNPDLATELRAAAQRDTSWVIKEIALDSESRVVDFNIMKRSTFSSLLEPDHSQTALFRDMNVIERQIQIKTRTLAELYSELQSEFAFKRPFLKMDTQGHDVAVIRGAGRLANSFVGLQSELGFTPLYKGAPMFYESLEYYKSLGFKLTALIPNNAGHFPDLNELDCIMYSSEFSEI